MTKFWTSASGSIKIEPEALHSFLNENGFYTYKPSLVATKILVKVKDKRVRQVTSDEMRSVCWNYLANGHQFSDDEERKQVKGEFIRSRFLFSPQNIYLLKEIQFKEVRDTKDKSYLFFKNCILLVTEDKISRLNYSEQEEYVWEEDICDHNLASPFPEDYKPNGEFYEFFLDITKLHEKEIEDQNRDSLITIIGYLLHRYKVPSLAKAIILMDTYIDGNPNGGTGKGLFSKALGYIRKTAFQDGKYFQRSDRFAYSSVTYGSRVLAIDDIPKDFDFERIFPLITEKLVIERKYENKIVIPFEESPKVLLTTNYTVEGKGSSHKRRKVEFIFSDTYNADYTPEDRFGHLIYHDWDSVEWDKFYFFMIHSLQMYLLKGLIPPMFNVAERTLKINATPEFIDYFEDDIDRWERYNKKEVYENFLTKYPKHKQIEQNTFTRWLKLYCDAYGYELIETHSGNDSFFALITDYYNTGNNEN